MGATSFMHEIDAASAREAFNALCQDATYEYGHDDYNGTISTCSLGRCRHTFPKFSAKNEQKATKMVTDTYGYGEKWTADYIDLGVVGYRTISTRKKAGTKAAAKWKMQYVLCPIFYEDEPRFRNQKPKGYDTKTEAEAAAKAAILKDENIQGFDICKQPVLVSGGEVVSTILREAKASKTKPRAEKAGTKVVPIHRYIFFGLAAS